MAAFQCPTGLAGLPSEVRINIASFCPYSTVLSLEKTCRAFHGLLSDLILVRQITDTVYYSSPFSNAGMWSSVHLDLRQARSVCVAVEMALKSGGECTEDIRTFLKSRIVLAVHSHPLAGAVDLSILQFCLHVARHYKLDDVIPDIAFSLIAATLERGVSENHFCELKGITFSRMDSLVVIAFLIVNLHRDSLKDIREALPRPQLSLIPFEALLGAFPSFQTGKQRAQYFPWRLQPSVSPSIFDCEWVGVYLRNWDTLYPFNSVQSVTKTGEDSLKASVTINEEPLDIESESFVMTPFGLVVFWRGVSWFWKKEWCNGNFSLSKPFSQEHELDFISCPIKLTLRQDFWVLVSTNGDLKFHKDQFNSEDEHTMKILNQMYQSQPSL